MKQQRYSIDPQTGCWNWLLYVTTYGYGWVNSGGKIRHAHIQEWEERNGTVPAGLHLDHKCRNRRCINPDHLEPVTNTENVRRGAACKLTLDQVTAIRERTAAGTPQTEIAKELKIHPAHVSKIVNGKAWISEIHSPLLTKRRKLSQHPGVTFNKHAGKWIAFASVNRKYLYLGLFETEDLAAQASLTHRQQRTERTEDVNHNGDSAGNELATAAANPDGDSKTFAF